MGAILAIIGERSSAVADELLKGMAAKAKHRGRLHSLCEGGFALGVQAAVGRTDASILTDGDEVAALHGFTGSSGNRKADENGAASLLARIRDHLTPDGVGALGGIRGEFAGVVYLRSRGLVAALRDQVGAKPLFWGKKGDLLVLASQVSQVLCGLGVKPELDESTLRRYVERQPGASTRTYFEGVRRLRPGELYLFEVQPAGDKRVRRVEYWTPPEGPVAPRDASAWAERLHGVLDEAVGRCLTGPRAAFPLSGGLDSSSVLAVAARVAGPGEKRQFRAYSLAYPGYPCDETALAGETASELNIPIRFVNGLGERHRFVTEQSARLETPAAGTLYQVALLAGAAQEDGADLLFGGGGGDEWFGDRWGVVLDLVARHELREARRVFLKAKSGRRLALLRQLVAQARGRGPTWLPESRKRSGTSRGLARSHVGVQSDGRVGAQEFARGELLDSLEFHRSGYVLESKEYICQLFGVEPRSPLLDTEVVEFAFKLPAVLLFQDALAKGFLRFAMRDVLGDHVRMRAEKVSFSDVVAHDDRLILRDLAERREMPGHGEPLEEESHDWGKAPAYSGRLSRSLDAHWFRCSWGARDKLRLREEEG